MIDRVDLTVCAQPHQMGKLHCDNPLLGQHDLQPLDEVVQIGDVGEDVVANQEIGAQPLSAQSSCGRLAEEIHTRRNSSAPSYLSNVSRRLYPEDRNLRDQRKYCSR